MNSRLLAAIFALMSAGTGCVVYDTGSHPDSNEAPGDVTFSWTFFGERCSDVPGVKGVHIDIPGEALVNDGFFPCQSDGFSGIVLHDFYPGEYTYTITAYDYSDEPLFKGAGSFYIDGDVRESVDLTPMGGLSSFAYLTWTFPVTNGVPNPSCAQAGIRFVDVRIDDGEWGRIDCSAGQTGGGVKTPLLDPGLHSITLVAVDETGYAYYRLQSSLRTQAGNPINETYALKWAVGGAAVRWDLKDGSLSKTCAQAGVQKVAINFEDENGVLIYGRDGDVHDCDSAPILYNFLQPGTYRVYLKGTGSGGVTYLSNAQNPPTVTIVAGEFAGPQDAGTVVLYKVN